MPVDLASREAPTVEERLEALRPLHERLTPRETEVLQLIADGYGNRDIAIGLHVSEETVKTHVQRLLRKLRATSRAHAVARGMRRRLIL